MCRIYLDASVSSGSTECSECPAGFFMNTTGMHHLHLIFFVKCHDGVVLDGRKNSHSLFRTAFNPLLFRSFYLPAVSSRLVFKYIRSCQLREKMDFFLAPKYKNIASGIHVIGFNTVWAQEQHAACPAQLDPTPMYQVRVCACVCVRACVRECVCVCLWPLVASSNLIVRCKAEPLWLILGCCSLNIDGSIHQ
jgi:hypothetical protein